MVDTSASLLTTAVLSKQLKIKVLLNLKAQKDVLTRKGSKGVRYSDAEKVDFHSQKVSEFEVTDELRV